MSTTRDLDALLQKFLRERQLPGASLSVYRGEEQLYEAYFGHQDMDRQIPLTPDSVFRVYSMTKPVTALCGLIQYERGAFLMDDPVSAYLPEYKHLTVSVRKPDGTWAVEEAKEPMRIRHLFNMNVNFFAHDDSPTVTGFRDMVRALGGSKWQGSYDLQTEIRALAAVPMHFEPGAHFQYGHGLDILGAVVEVTSGKSLGAFMKENIFDPLGMEHTDFFFRPGWKARLMDCVEHLPDGSVKKAEAILGDPIDAAYRPEAKYESPSAGLLSTLRDYQAFTSMLAAKGTWKGEHIIGRKTVDMMRLDLLDATKKADMDAFFQGETLGYGYGCGVRTLVDPAAALCNGSVGEFGWVGAAGTWMMADPAENLAAVFVIQDLLPDDTYYHRRIYAAVNGLL